MTRFTFRLPDIGEGIAEAEIVAWHRRIGETIAENEPLADMMTDKATVELESPVTGRIVEVAGEPGDRIAIGAALAVIEVEGEGESAGAAEARAEPGPAPPPPPPPPAASVREEQAPAAPEPSRPAEARVLASPAVRARARALGVDLALVRHAGEHIRHADLDAFLRYSGDKGYHAPGASRAWRDETVKVLGLRRRIAENMAAAKRHIPHFTYVEETDVTALEALRGELNAARGARPKLTLLPFLIVALCRTLADFPMLNAHYDDEANVVTRHGHVHIGIATQTDAGLMVPVLRDAQDHNLWQLAGEIARLAAAGRGGTASREELSGSTFTLSSLGALGGITSTPVINRPEVAILAPNRIVERPVFAGEQVKKALMMNLSISCDHRVVDGWDAASFVQALRRLIEAPALLFAD
ncbi:MAG: 2-oxo acid dehydrogenase subunit E2 [Sphingomonadales bacterium]|nr:2-oxo acid dehydrogenase subunit E2 [Sphingomonadales bacterium]